LNIGIGEGENVAVEKQQRGQWTALATNLRKNYKLSRSVPPSCFGTNQRALILGSRPPFVEKEGGL